MHSPASFRVKSADPMPPSSEEAVKVICRVRPFNQREIFEHDQSNRGKETWDQLPLRSIVEFDKGHCYFLGHDKDWAIKEQFHFDQCLWSIPDEVQYMENNPFAGQEGLYNEVGTTLMDQAWRGYNTCVFAYGQTGSGKTYSMMGSDYNNDPGLIPRVCQRLFEMINQKREKVAEEHSDQYKITFKVEVRYVEIYNESIKDLLFSLSTLPPEIKAKINEENMKMRFSPATGCFVENVTSVEVDSWERMIELIDLGNTCRHTAATKMNERSSRSHAIFKILLNQTTTSVTKKAYEKPVEHIRESVINLVDLAGSERNKKTGATGERFKEAVNINRSLLALKQVIEVLADNSTSKGRPKPIPYRDSHLTSLLADSLGGNSKTFMLCCISPHWFNADETLQTLRYGARARQIVNIVRVNENSQSRMFLELEEELGKMKNEMDKVQDVEKINELKKEIDTRETMLKELEGQMELQQKKVELLQVEKQREQLKRGAVALTKVLGMRQLDEKIHEADLERQRLQGQLSSVEHTKEELDQRLDRAEHDEDRLLDQLEGHRARAIELAQEILHLKSRNVRLAEQIHDLEKSNEKQQVENEKLGNERILAILRARAEAARIWVAARHLVQTMTEDQDSEISKLEALQNKDAKRLQEEYAEKNAAVTKDTTALRQEAVKLSNKLNMIETERKTQIAALEDEAAALENEFKALEDNNSARKKHTEQEWERKYAAMIDEMQAKQDSLDGEWDEKQRKTIEAEKLRATRALIDLQSELDHVKQKWDELKHAAVVEGTRKCVQAEDAWRKKFNAKLQENKELRATLQGVEEKEHKAADLMRRMSSVPPRLSNPKNKSKEFIRVVRLLKGFQGEYEANQLSKSQIAQLLHGDFEAQRCTEVPFVEETAAVKDADGTAPSGARAARPRRAISPFRTIPSSQKPAEAQATKKKR